VQRFPLRPEGLGKGKRITARRTLSVDTDSKDIHRQYKKGSNPQIVSLRPINFCIVMYKQLTEPQRYEIYLGLRKGNGARAA